MSEADKIIKNLKNSGKKVEEFYVSNKTSDKNVAKIEDDVNELKSIMNLRTESGFAYSQKNTLKLQKSIRNVLAEREQDKKRIQELEADLYSSNEIIADLTDSIPKQVVIDKMEELNKEIKSCDEIDAIFKIKQQQVLQELLEGGRK